MWAVIGAVVVGAWAVSSWVLWRRLRAAEEALRDLKPLRREIEQTAAEGRRALAVTRRHVLDVAQGSPPPREVILEGRAWRPVEPAAAQSLWERDTGLFVLDVRTPAEFEAGHVPRAHLIPLDELEDRLAELPGRHETILVTCAAGGRSTQACQLLAEHGYTNLLNLSGGMHAWRGPRESSAPGPAKAAPAGPTEPSIVHRGGAITSQQVVGAIRECFDPEIPLNVYDLGLIYGIDIDESRIGIRMTLTSESCPSARQIPEEVKRRVAALGQPNVDVEVVFDPPWHPARISPDGKAKLGLA